MIHVMLPVQYLRKPGDREIEPQKRLMLAVLKTVIDDYQASQTRRAVGLRPPVDRNAYRDARAYLECTDRSWPFTFENLCDALGLDAGAFRRGLTGEAPVTNSSTERRRGHRTSAPLRNF